MPDKSFELKDLKKYIVNLNVLKFIKTIVDLLLRKIKQDKSKFFLLSRRFFIL